MSACFYEILYLFKTATEKQQDAFPGSQYHNVNREYMVYVIDDYINQYFSRQISVSTLAETIHLSERQIHRIVQETYGQTFRQRVIFLRIKNATVLLTETDMSIKRIANTVGYQTLNSFYKAFSRYHTMTPEQYRRLYAKKNLSPDDSND